MNIINIIVSEKGYTDRFNFFLNLDPYVENQIIFTREYFTKTKLKNTVIKTPEKKLTGYKFWIWVAKETKKILETTDQKWVIIEHLNGLALLLIKLIIKKIKKRPIYVVALYSENFYYLFKRAWSLDNNSPYLSTKHQYFYYKNWIVRCSLEFIYILISDAVIANGPQVLEFTKKKFPSKPVYLIKNSISINNTISLQQKSSINPTSLNFLFIGAMMPAKGIATLLASLRLLSKRNIVTRLSLIGRVMKQDKLWFESLLKSYKDLDIKIIPHVNYNELESFYKETDFFVFPSFSEGSPRVILEALNWNCTVICSEIEAIKSIDPDGQMVTYFKAGSAISLTEKILELSTQKQDLSKSYLIKKNLVDQHSNEVLAPALINFYKSLY